MLVSVVLSLLLGFLAYKQHVVATATPPVVTPTIVAAGTLPAATPAILVAATSITGCNSLDAVGFQVTDSSQSQFVMDRGQVAVSRYSTVTMSVVYPGGTPVPPNCFGCNWSASLGQNRFVNKNSCENAKYIPPLIGTDGIIVEISGQSKTRTLSLGIDPKP